MDIDRIMNYVIPFASILASFLLGQWSKTKSQKTEIQMKRFNNFYIPYLQLLIQTWPDSIDPNFVPIEKRIELKNLLINNIQYLGKESSDYLPFFIEKDLFSLLERSGHVQYEGAYNDFYRSFILMNKYVLSEAKGLAKELKYPIPSEHVLNTYSHQQALEQLD